MINLTNNQGPSLTGNLATEDDIVCDSITGAVTCVDVVNDITLTGSLTGSMTVGDVTGNIAIGGDLGTSGSPYTAFSAADVTGSITISRYLWDDVSVNTLADFTAGDFTGSTISGDIAIAQGYSGTLTINSTYGGAITVGGEMSGLIDINRNMSGSVTIGTPGTNANLSGEIEFAAGGTVLVNGNVTSAGLIENRTFLSGLVKVTGDLAGQIDTALQIASNGHIDIDGSVTSTGSIEVGTFVAGDIDIVDDLNGQITIGGDLDTPGRIDIVDAVSQTDATTPAIHIHGSLDDDTVSDPEIPMIEVAGELDGVIAVDGGLDNAVDGPEIHVGSIDLENLGAIAIDYDGWDDATWAAAAASAPAGRVACRAAHPIA